MRASSSWPVPTQRQSWSNSVASVRPPVVAEVGVARTLETTHYEVLKTVHAHPTLSEAIMEAVGNAYGEAIHL